MKPAIWLNQNAEGWRALTRGEKEAIRDFPVLWAVFELGACNARANPHTIAAAVDALRSVRLTPTLHRARDYFADRYYPNGRNNWHFESLNLTNGNRDFNPKELVTQVLRGDIRSDREVVKALLQIVNRLRNNFLHGEKQRYGFADQKGNFDHGNRVLMEVIPWWLDRH